MSRAEAWREYYETNMLAQTDSDLSGDAFGAGWDAAMAEALADAAAVAARLAEAYKPGDVHRGIEGPRAGNEGAPA